ncbi:MAG: UDP-N-acetylglucosamine 1-carboxyvinyltransferase [Candidatus Dojkabacteria bacterium]|nr:UDP-N-acetylglucosamine 1-carboxyvinyltransferase [Candidatus Dojkabacteria bacterium]
MSSIVIEGQAKIQGTVTPLPNKNSILKLIPASILIDGKVLIKNVPNSSSVKIMLEIFKRLGGQVQYVDSNVIELDSSQISDFCIDEELSIKERSSFLFIGPLLQKFKEARITDGGGCKLGNRPIDTMFLGLSLLGVEIDIQDKYILKAKNGLLGNNIWLLESSVTGTENLVLASVKAKGKTTIYNAACEPHTQDLCNFLVKAGAKINGIGTNKLEIEGVDKLNPVEWEVIPDHIDIGCLIVSALITGGEIKILNAIPNHMTQIINNFKKFNAEIIIDGNNIIVPADQKLVAKKNLKGDIDKIVDQPWPGFPTDLIPQSLILALSSEGIMRIYSNMYETQLIELYNELLKMNAKMIMTSPHQIITLQKNRLKGTKVNATSVLQSTHALFLAGLIAEGTTIIENADIIFRRFPDIITTYNKLGAKVSKIS